MVTVQEIYGYIDDLAPFRHQEPWDNSGLLLGEGSQQVNRVIVALDATGEVVERAVAWGADLVITHHPLIFHPLKSIPGHSPVAMLLRGNLALISAHTNLDVANGGVNDQLAARLGLLRVVPFAQTSEETYRTVVVFAPKSHGEAVRQAMIQGGGGTLGNYSGCSFSSGGTGCFRPEDGSNPYLGRPGAVERVEEERIEMLVSPGKLQSVLYAMGKAHPYEKPAFGVFENRGVVERVCLGRLGELEEPMDPETFARFVGERLGSPGIRLASAKKTIRRVAVCGGSGGSLMEEAASLGAHALVTAEVKHDRLLAAVEAGMSVVDVDHYSSEAVVLEPLRARLAQHFPQVDFQVDLRGGNVLCSL